MAAGLKERPSRTVGLRRSASPPHPDRVLYLYGISPAAARSAATFPAQAVDGSDEVEGLILHGFCCWFSRVDRVQYADQLANNMENLEWLAEASFRHQQAVGRLASAMEFLPVRFGTVFLSEASLGEHLSARKPALKRIFQRIRGSAEWGIKVFRERQSAGTAVVEAKSGREYLRRKADAAKAVSGAKYPEVEKFGRELEGVSVAVAPGGKASTGQPGLVWHGSFLVKKTQEPKLMALLKRASRNLAGEFRIECSGPWPPYSFVDDDVR